MIIDNWKCAGWKGWMDNWKLITEMVLDERCEWVNGEIVKLIVDNWNGAGWIIIKV